MTDVTVRNLVSRLADKLVSRLADKLVSRLADKLDHYRQLLTNSRYESHALAVEARSFLAQPAPQDKRPTDEELLQEWDLVSGAQVYEEDVVDFARAVLASWGNVPESLNSLDGTAVSDDRELASVDQQTATEALA